MFCINFNARWEKHVEFNGKRNSENRLSSLLMEKLWLFVSRIAVAFHFSCYGNLHAFATKIMQWSCVKRLCWECLKDCFCTKTILIPQNCFFSINRRNKHNLWNELNLYFIKKITTSAGTYDIDICDWVPSIKCSNLSNRKSWEKWKVNALNKHMVSIESSIDTQTSTNFMYKQMQIRCDGQAV